MDIRRLVIGGSNGLLRINQQVDIWKSKLEEASEDRHLKSSELWDIFDSIFEEAFAMFPDSMDMMAMAEAVRNKKTRRNPIPALNTLLTALEKIK